MKKEWEIEEVKKVIQNFNYIVGIDEVGRGCLAGPLLVCSLIQKPTTFINGVKDSKELTHKKREILFNNIIQNSYGVGIGIVSNKTIDEYGIGISLRLAILKSLSNLPFLPKLIITDYVKIRNKKFEGYLKNTQDVKIISIYQ
ncbi:MAG: hypothetical protein ACP5PT_07865, partial [Brevinematia bacterium]